MRVGRVNNVRLRWIAERVADGRQTLSPLHWLVAKPWEICSATKWPKTENLSLKL